MKTLYISVSIISLLFSWRYTDLEKKIHNVNLNFGAKVLFADDRGLICSKLEGVSKKKYKTEYLMKYTLSLDKGWKHNKLIMRSQNATNIKCFRDGSDSDSYYFSINYSSPINLNDTLTVIMTYDNLTENCVLLKTDDKLNIKWIKNITENVQEIGEVKLDNKGNYIIAGFSYNEELDDDDTILLKLDNELNTLWQYTIFTRFRNSHLSIIVDKHDNLYFSYPVFTEPGHKVVDGSLFRNIRKYCENGKLQWERVIPVCFNDFTQFIMGPDSLLYMFSARGGRDDGHLHLLKIDLNGNIVFEKREKTNYVDNLSLIDIDLYGNLYFSFNTMYDWGYIGEKKFLSEDEEYWEVCYSESFELIESRQKFLRLRYYLPVPTKYRGTKVFKIFKKYSKFNLFRKKSRKGYVKIYTADVPIFFDTENKRTKQ